MTARWYYLSAVVLLSLLLIGCHSPGSRSTQLEKKGLVGLRLNPAQAVEIAKNAAGVDGAAWNNYEELTARTFSLEPELVRLVFGFGAADPDPSGRVWSVHFEPRGGPKCPGDFFDVLVDDKTGRTFLEGGL
jgi:hypothetical protein